MNILIISSSLNPQSRGSILCRLAYETLSENENVTVKFLDLKDIELPHVFRGTLDAKTQELVAWADSYILGMAVYCYNLNDSLVSFISLAGNNFKGKERRPFGIICAGGGERSYLSVTHLMEMMINEYRMTPIPRVVYVSGKDDIENPDITRRVKELCQDITDF